MAGDRWASFSTGFKLVVDAGIVFLLHERTHLKELRVARQRLLHRIHGVHERPVVHIAVVVVVVGVVVVGIVVVEELPQPLLLHAPHGVELHVRPHAVPQRQPAALFCDWSIGRSVGRGKKKTKERKIC